MEHVVTVLFAIQALAGVVLTVAWWRRGKHGVGTLVAHVVPNTTALALWVLFTVFGNVWWAWGSYFALNIGTAFGDKMLVGRYRRVRTSEAAAVADYGGALKAVFTRRMPPLVTFHAVFSAAVYFSCLAVCIGATVSALNA